MPGSRMISPRLALAIILLLLVVRAIAAALLPLSADEAYYWLWSRHLAAGYFDHPPAIAWLIRCGTALFGDTPFGVRFAGVLLPLPATGFVWRTGRLIFKDETRAATAALFFNLTLMVSVEMLAATPDMPSLLTSAAMLYFLAKVQDSRNGVPPPRAGRALAGEVVVAGSRASEDRTGPVWLAFGAAAGLGLLSKYSALFLGAGTLIWLIADRNARPWLRTPWPWLAGMVALAIFAPNLVWQARHHWETFAFQFGRTAQGHFTLRYLGEFIGAQFGLATPLIFVLIVCGLRNIARRDNVLLLPAILAWTGLAYFLEHALHDRVQGNWPCFLYPALAILAASAVRQTGWWKWPSRLAAPLAALLLALVYAQAGFGVIALKNDPAARILGRDFHPAAEVAAAFTKAHLADAILTTDYETTAWLRFTEPGVPVIQVNEPWRYPDAPAPAKLLQGRLMYLVEMRRDQHHLLQQDFALVGFPTQLQSPGGLYMLYPVAHPRQADIGRMP